MSRFKQDFSCDLKEVLLDPTAESGERLWRRVTEWKDRYPRSWNSLKRDNPFLLEIFETILEVGNEVGWRRRNTMPTAQTLRAVSNRQVEHRIYRWVFQEWDLIICRPMPDFSWHSIAKQVESHGFRCKVVRGTRKPKIIYVTGGNKMKKCKRCGRLYYPSQEGTVEICGNCKK